MQENKPKMIEVIPERYAPEENRIIGVQFIAAVLRQQRKRSNLFQRLIERCNRRYSI